MSHACPQCGTTTPGPRGLCPDDQRLADERKNNRPQARVWQSPRFRKLVEVVRREEPECRDCLERGIHTPTACVAHITPFTGPNDPKAWDRTNLKGSCLRCNSSEAGRRAHSPQPSPLSQHGEGVAADMVYVA